MPNTFLIYKLKGNLMFAYNIMLRTTDYPYNMTELCLHFVCVAQNLNINILIKLAKYK